MTDKPLNTTPTLQNTPGCASTDNIMQNGSEKMEIPELIHMHDQLHDCIFAFRTDNLRFTYVNKGAQHQVGYTDVELLEMTPLDIKPEFTLESFQEMVQPLIDGTQSLHIFQTIHRHKNGHDIPVEVVLQLMHHGSLESCFLAIVRDNTAYQDIDNTLRERIKEMRCLFLVRELLMSRLSINEIFQQIATHLTAAMQFPELAAVAMEFNGNRLVSPNYRQDYSYGLHAEIKLDDRCSGQLHVFYSEDKPFMLPFEQNLIAAIANDLQLWFEREHTQDKLNLALKQTNRIQSALDAHSIVATTDQRGTITYVNSKFCEVSKYAAEELIGQNHRMLNSGHHPKGFFQEMWKTISSGCIWKGEIKNRAKDGTFYWVATTIVPYLDGEGKPVQYITIRTEITKRKLMEESLIQAREEADRANHAKDSFLATMSHEIRTPLGGLLGMLELLEYTPLNKDQTEILQTASDSGQNLLRILNDILDWSKIDAGKLQLAPIDTSITDLVIKVVNTYARVASAKSLVLTHQIDARINNIHIVDPLRLTQILNNFVSNALKFTSRGHVKVQVELLGRCGDIERLRFSVEDTGIGITEDVQSSLFQDYSQSSAETARMYGGTGLGLSICRRLVELMDGKIELKSELGQGTTFSVTLDLPVSCLVKKEVPNEQTLTTASLLSHFSAAAQSNEPTILVVDDHPVNRKLMVSQLNLLGLSCKTAENGQVALEIWRDGKFILIITDCHMPVMDGYQLTQAIRQIEVEEQRHHIPILGWSANALPEESRHCQSVGMNVLLTKPTNMLQLKEALEVWLPPIGSDEGDTAVVLHRKKSSPIEIIDSTVLATFSLTTADITIVLQGFMEQTRSDFNELEAALEQQNLPECMHIAHRMKGASKMVGASELAAACEAAEKFARLSATKDVNAVKELMVSAIERLEVYISETIIASCGDKNDFN